MTNFKMTFKPIFLLLATVCCASCISVNSQMGKNFLPREQIYDIFTGDHPLTDIEVQMADRLSGYSSTRITIGALREDSYGITTRASAFALVPARDTLDFGSDPVFQRFIFTTSYDTLSCASDNQRSILQNVYVYELESPLDPVTDSDCNKEIKHRDKILTKGIPVLNGRDSLTFEFTEEFGKRFLDITQDDLSDINKYLAKFPGIYMETSKPLGNGGRINLLNLQLDFDNNQYYIKGNYARLFLKSTYQGVKKDTSFLFYFGALDFCDIDSLLVNGTSGHYPEVALNLTGHQTRERAGKVEELIPIEGGGGLKPVIPALHLKHLAEEIISKEGADPKSVIINKASLVFPFTFPENYKEMEKWPYRLSPTCKVVTDESVAFVGLSDSSSSDENQGDIDRSNLNYAPDITFHLQELLKIDETDTGSEKTKKLMNGSYDIWLLIMANELVVQESTTSSSDMNDYYQYLAYQSYYNNMYGGYGGYGYGGYGYGGYGYGGYNDYYSNYYNYMMMAQYASASQASYATDIQLDRDRFYKAALNGPAHESGLVPTLELTFSVPNIID